MSKAKEAMVAEVNDDIVTFEFRGEKFTIAIGDSMDMDACLALEKRMIQSFIEAIMGPDQMLRVRMKCAVKNRADVTQLGSAIFTAMGVTQGE